MKIHVARCPKAGSGIPLKLGFAPKRTDSPFACLLLAGIALVMATELRTNFRQSASGISDKQGFPTNRKD
jgi:hypothetical protein